MHGIFCTNGLNRTLLSESVLVVYGYDNVSEIKNCCGVLAKDVIVAVDLQHSNFVVRAMAEMTQ